MYTLFRIRACGSYDRSAEDAYSSMASDPTLPFVGGLHCSLLDFVYIEQLKDVKNRN
jgi:hypothetical protein